MLHCGSPGLALGLVRSPPGDDDVLRAGRMYSASGGGPSVLPGASRGLEGFNHLINPAWGRIAGTYSFADPVSHNRFVVRVDWVPGDTINDKFSILSIDCLGTYPV